MPPPQWFQRDQLIMWCSQADGCAWESTLQQKPYQTPIGQKKIGIISPLSCRKRQQLRQRWIYDSAAQLGGNNGKRSIRGCSWSLLDTSHGGWRVEGGWGDVLWRANKYYYTKRKKITCSSVCVSEQIYAIWLHSLAAQKQLLSML